MRCVRLQICAICAQNEPAASRPNPPQGTLRNIFGLFSCAGISGSKFPRGAAEPLVYVLLAGLVQSMCRSALPTLICTHSIKTILKAASMINRLRPVAVFLIKCNERVLIDPKMGRATPPLAHCRWALSQTNTLKRQTGGANGRL